MPHPDALPHDLPAQVDEDLFVVYGCVKPRRSRFSRNMAIIRDNGVLTLINPVRMNEDGLRALERLGEVGHVLRLGPFHGIDDPFYVERYHTSFWSFTDGEIYNTPQIDHALREDGPLPFSGARLFAFSHLKSTEGCILLERSPSNILLTCDSIQSYATPPYKPHTDWLVKRLMPLFGFPNTTLIGPFWTKLLATDKAKLELEFRRLLTLDFDRLLSAHGTFLPANARAEVQRAFQKMFA